MVLPIKRHWFEMILSGEKKEEYRDVTPYYEARFRNLFKNSAVMPVTFRNGYRADSPYVEALCSVSRGCGKPEWGAVSGKNYFVLTILSIISFKE